MANSNDAQFMAQLVSVPEEMAPVFFAKYAAQLVDDSAYWGALGTLWKAQGSVLNQSFWIPLFMSNRRNRNRLMKARERRTFNKLPATVTAYRAVNTPEEAETAISWSLDKALVARVFSHGGARPIVTRQFQRSEILAYFDRRKEQEIIVINGINVHRR